MAFAKQLRIVVPQLRCAYRDLAGKKPRHVLAETSANIIGCAPPVNFAPWQAITYRRCPLPTARYFRAHGAPLYGKYAAPAIPRRLVCDFPMHSCQNHALRCSDIMCRLRHTRTAQAATASTCSYRCRHFATCECVCVYVCMCVCVYVCVHVCGCTGHGQNKQCIDVFTDLITT